MVRIRTDGKSLPDPIRIDQLHGQKVAFGDGRRVGDPERIFSDGLDRSPDVDDLVAAFEEAVGIVGQVVPDALGAGFVGLINVHALHRAAQVEPGGVGRVGGRAADGVVEDEDFGGAGAGQNGLSVNFIPASGFSWSRPAPHSRREKRQKTQERVTLRRL